MNVMKTLLVASISSAVLVTSVMAQEPLLKPVDQVGQVPTLQNQKQYSQYRVVSSAVDGNKLSDRSAGRLIAGTEVINTLSGERGQVSGVIAVMINDTNIDALAQQFGLSVERRYDRLNMALLKAADGTDMVTLRKDMMATGDVTGIDIEIIEELRKVQ